jgi:serine/threonine-protein kinase SRPK3
MSSDTLHRDPLYNLIVTTGDAERYEQGGYYLVNIGDEFQGRYKDVHKLSYGSYSTIWLVRDRRHNRYAAPKISTADALSEPESQALQHLGLQRNEGPWSKLIVEVLDEFEIMDPNGKHKCIVAELLGLSLSFTVDHLEDGRLPRKIAWKIIVQLVERVA